MLVSVLHAFINSSVCILTLMLNESTSMYLIKFYESL